MKRKKSLTQAVFDGQHEKVVSAEVDSEGTLTFNSSIRVGHHTLVYRVPNTDYEPLTRIFRDRLGRYRGKSLRQRCPNGVPLGVISSDTKQICEEMGMYGCICADCKKDLWMYSSKGNYGMIHRTTVKCVEHDYLKVFESIKGDPKHNDLFVTTFCNDYVFDGKE
jgi:hypothetical protein